MTADHFALQGLYEKEDDYDAQRAQPAAVPVSGITPPNGYVPLKIGDVEIPFEAETKHIVINGGTGAGKTQANSQILENWRERGIPAWIIDNGNLLAKFWEPGDQIYCPFDRRSVLWDYFNEIRALYDYDKQASYAVEELHGEGKFWSTRTVHMLADMTEKLDSQGVVFQNHDWLMKFLTEYPVHDDGSGKASLQSLLAGTLSASQFEKGAEKALTSTLDVLKQNLRSLRYAKGGGSFSLREWVETLPEPGSEKRAPWLWLLHTKDTFEAQRTILGLQASVLINAMLGLPENLQRRIGGMLDELASLGQIRALPEAFNELRKVGGMLVFSTQSIGQTAEIYGETAAQSFIDNAGTLLMLRSGAPETNQYFSDLIGEDEVLEPSTSKTENNDADGNTTTSNTTSWSKRIKPHMLPSEFSRQPDRQGFLRVSGTEHIATPVTIPVNKRAADAAPRFVPIEGIERPRRKQLNTGGSNA